VGSTGEGKESGEGYLTPAGSSGYCFRACFPAPRKPVYMVPAGRRHPTLFATSSAVIAGPRPRQSVSGVRLRLTDDFRHSVGFEDKRGEDAKACRHARVQWPLMIS